ncbi:MAG: exodeoxyribonuclease V subunit alpha, partial [Desulfuromusa sp.]|nr:exodeoxyribonuclease V subunit alpha [Desulfuromusa sp.]
MLEYALTAIDRHFSAFIQTEAGSDSLHLKQLTSLLSNAVGSGDTCLNLPDIAGQEVQLDGLPTILPGYSELQKLLQSTSVVGAPGDYRPLILDPNGRLYLLRYWEYEQKLAQILLDKGQSNQEEINVALLKTGLDRLFPETASAVIDWQRVAALAAVRKKFCVISGGPGTGKTSTVIKILALLLEQAAGAPLRIALAAPTGKSAARLKESIGQMKGALKCTDAIKERIPQDVSTIHRLLGYIPGSVQFRFNQENPLPDDVVIIDEASMVPLTLMAKLVTSLKPSARFILLGDRDQLASVEAGAVLGDICGGGREESFSAEFNTLFAELGTGQQIPLTVSKKESQPLLDSLVVLKKNYRFSDAGGIGVLGQAINAGDGGRALSLLTDASRSDIGWQKVPQIDGLKRALRDIVIAGYGSYLEANTASEALQRFDTFRILCSLRQGHYGVSAINSLVENILADAGLIDPHNRWYHGRPVMVTVNDYNLKLFNGDIGIIFQEEGSNGSPRVCFPAADDSIRRVPMVRLPQHETVYAMTVHKSQGSEFDRLLLLLPDRDSEGLSRE